MVTFILSKSVSPTLGGCEKPGDKTEERIKQLSSSHGSHMAVGLRQGGLQLGKGWDTDGKGSPCSAYISELKAMAQ